MSGSSVSDNATIRISLSGDVREVSAGSTPLQLLQSLTQKPEGVLAAKLNGKSVDLKCPLLEDGELTWLTPADPEGKEVLFHSTTHLMAQAVTELFPTAKLAIGPPIEEGYYYDYGVEKPFTPEDLEQIETRMRELASKGIPVERFDMSGEEQKTMYGGFMKAAVSKFGASSK